jgi:hypothetical protein
MRGTHLKSFSSYRDAIAERVKGGEPFGDVEDAIDDVAGLSMDEKAALWLYARSFVPNLCARTETLKLVRALEAKGR